MKHYILFLMIASTFFVGAETTGNDFNQVYQYNSCGNAIEDQELLQIDSDENFDLEDLVINEDGSVSNYQAIRCQRGRRGPAGPPGPCCRPASSFSAQIITLNIPSATETEQLTGYWDKSTYPTTPFYTGPDFDPTTGNFTVPATGKYSVKITVNYNTTATATANLSGNVPAFALRKASDTTNILAGNFPLLDVSIGIVPVTIRAILGTGQVVIAGDVELTEGDVIGLYYIGNASLNVSINLGGGITPGVVWSMFSLN